MRLVVRWKSFKKLDFDDGFVIFAWVLALLTAIDWQIVAGFMYQFIAITRGQLWPPPATFVDDSERYFTGSAVFIIFFYTSLWAVKISFLLFFKRLGLNVRRQKVLWWCVFAFTIATYLSCIGNIQYSCLVVPLAELVKHCSNDWEINFQQTTLKFNCAVDVLTDLMSNVRLFQFAAQVISNGISYVNSNQYVMESSNTAPEKGGLDRHLFSHCYHDGICRCPRHFY